MTRGLPNGQPDASRYDKNRTDFNRTRRGWRNLAAFDASQNPTTAIKCVQMDESLEQRLKQARQQARTLGDQTKKLIAQSVQIWISLQHIETCSTVRLCCRIPLSPASGLLSVRNHQCRTFSKSDVQACEEFNTDPARHRHGRNCRMLRS